MKKRPSIFVKAGNVDFTFLIMVIIILIFGLTMMFSASSAPAHYMYDDAFYFIKRQLFFALLGLVGMYIVSQMDHRLVKNLSFPLLIITVILLILVLIIGQEIKGAKRWISIGPLSFQPSELAKYCVIIFMATSISARKKKIERFVYDFCPYLLFCGIIAGLVFLEDHLSGAFTVFVAGMIVLFVGGAKIWHFLLFLPPVALAVIAAIAFEPYRLKRFLSFLDPFENYLGDGFQIVQSLYAIGSGGFFGLGLGQSRQKYLYIPEPHNDFIFPVICEELGFFGATLLILLFAILIWRGIKIAIDAPDNFSSMVVLGIIGLIGFQVMINIAVVTGSMPVTGMPLPFFSYGGTALFFQLLAMGFVLNISRYSKDKNVINHS